MSLCDPLTVCSRCLRAHKLAVKGGLEVTPDMEVDVISYKEGLYLATLGGARALNIEVRRKAVEVCWCFWAVVWSVAPAHTDQRVYW